MVLISLDNNMFMFVTQNVVESCVKSRKNYGRPRCRDLYLLLVICQ